MINLTKIKDVIADVIFPPSCISCKKFLEKLDEKRWLLCFLCQSKVGAGPGLSCSKCSKRLWTIDNDCHRGRGFALFALCSYDNRIARHAIHLLKYKKTKAALRSLGFVIDSCKSEIKRIFDDLDPIIIPVPLHKKKERERGYNQSLLIAELLRDKIAGSIIDTESLKKIRNTQTQTNLSHREREKNIKNSFAITKLENIKNRNVILVDDVFTSGATMQEAINTIREVKPRQIAGFVVAKA